jgi:hypothetical protein
VRTTRFLLSLLFLTSACNLARTNLFFKEPEALVQSDKPENFGQSLQLGDRSYVESAMKDVFEVTPEIPEAKQLEDLIYYDGSFGGGCDLYGASEVAAGATVEAEFKRASCGSGLSESQSVHSSAQRMAQAVKACDVLIHGANTFPRVMTKIIPGWAPGKPANRPTPERLMVAYALFDRTGSLPDAVTEKLMDLANSVSDADESWRWVLKAYCESPEFLQAW